VIMPKGMKSQTFVLAYKTGDARN